MSGYRKGMSRQQSRKRWNRSAGKRHRDNDRRPMRGGRRK